MKNEKQKKQEKQKNRLIDIISKKPFYIAILAILIFAICFFIGICFIWSAISELFSASVGLAQSGADSDVFRMMGDKQQWSEYVSSGEYRINSLGYGKTGLLSWLHYSGAIYANLFIAVTFLLFCGFLLYGVYAYRKALKCNQENFDVLYLGITEKNRELEMKIDQLNAEKIRFEETVQNVCHQFKTPLAGLRLTIEKMETADERRNTCLQTIDKLSEKVIAMLNLGKLESNVIQMEKKKEDLAVAVYDSIDAVMPLAEDGGVRIETRIQEPAEWSFNYFWVREALENILKNAIECSKVGDTVMIRLERMQNAYHLYIQDMAGGVKQNHIFERYTSSRGNGFGIGLHLADTIIRYHLGSVAVYDNEMGGTTFQVVLPILTGAEPYII